MGDNKGTHFHECLNLDDVTESTLIQTQES